MTTHEHNAERLARELGTTIGDLMHTRRDRSTAEQDAKALIVYYLWCNMTYAQLNEWASKQGITMNHLVICLKRYKWLKKKADAKAHDRIETFTRILQGEQTLNELQA